MENLSFELAVNNERDEDDEDEQEEMDRQKELNGLLSNAFDDLSPVTSEDDEEYEGNVQNRHSLTNGVEAASFQKQQHSRNSHRESVSAWALPSSKTSTPQMPAGKISRKSRFVNGGHNEIQTNYFQENDNSGLQNGFKSSNSSLDSYKELPDDHVGDEDLNDYNHTHVQCLLDENKKLSNELMILKQKFSASRGDFEVLEFKLKELEKMNEEKDCELVRLEGRVSGLVIQAATEKEAKEECQRKLKVADATIESLKEQLMELERSDCLVRARETHEVVVERLRQKHETELLLLRGEVEGLRRELDSKKSEIVSLNNQIAKETQERSFNEQVKEMVEMTRSLWETQMKEKMETEMKLIVSNLQTRMSQTSHEDVKKIKCQWEVELQNDVDQLVRRITVKSEQSPRRNHFKLVNIQLHPIFELWEQIEKEFDERESALMGKIEEIRATKEQLSNVLAESRTSGIKQVNESLLNGLKFELEKVKQESEEMKHKLHKYKLHYHQLIKQHKAEVAGYKNQLALFLKNTHKNFNLKGDG